MSYRFRTDPYAEPRPSTTRVARNAMLAMLIAFVALALMFLFLGDIDQSIRAQQIPGPSYEQVKLEYAERLSSYGWVDRSAGTVHIPIDEAIRLTAERGLPTRPGQ